MNLFSERIRLIDLCLEVVKVVIDKKCIVRVQRE